MSIKSRTAAGVEAKPQVIEKLLLPRKPASSTSAKRGSYTSLTSSHYSFVDSTTYSSMLATFQANQAPVPTPPNKPLQGHTCERQ